MPVTAAVPQFTPAAYVTAADITAATDLDVSNVAVVTRAIADATEIMWAATGRQFTGPVVETIRPCCTSYLYDGIPESLWMESGAPYVPVIAHGQWYNLGGPVDVRKCVAYDCGILYGRLDLFVFPVLDATVLIDGAEFTGYQIDENRYLTRLDGALWPPSQNVLLADDQPGTWSVTFTHGISPPGSVKNATARLAAELIRATDPDGQCSLPKSALTVNRQGITYQLPSVIDLVSKGRTGIYEIDIAVVSVNPNGLMERPRVASADRRVGPHRHG